MKTSFFSVLTLLTLSIARSQTYSAPTTPGTVGVNSVYLGTNAAKDATGGDSNVFVGHEAGRYNTSSDNVFLGFHSGLNNQGQRSVFIGSNSGVSSTGSNNVFVGEKSGEANTVGYDNTFLGIRAGLVNSIGNNNTFLGRYAGSSNTTGNYNTLLGSSSGQNITTGYTNIVVGYGAGGGLATGNGNILFGQAATPYPSALSNSIIFSAAGYQRFYISSTGNAGIGLGDNVIPNNRLEIKSAASNASGLRFTNLTSAFTPTATDSKFLTLDANGDVILRNIAVSTGTSGTNLTLSGNQLSLTNPLTPGNSVTLPQTNITAGTNVTITGNGSTATPYVITANGSSTDTSIYKNDGVIDQSTTTGLNRVVDLNDRNLFFSSANSPANGKIYIGNTSSYPTATGDYRLYVEGGVLTEKVKVALRSTSNWADYVFADDYALKPLSEVESFINKNKHLPNVPSSEDLKKSGLDLSDMQARQMEKIEELTLYAISQEKTISSQKEILEKQQKEIDELKQMVQSLVKSKN